MPSKLHDEGLRISNKYRTKALVEYQAECGGGSQSGAICPSSCNPTCPPVKPCPDPKGRKPGFNCPPKGKCYDAACKCKPHYAEYHPRIVHPSQRPFITSLQVQEVRPSMNLRTIKNRDIPGIDFVQQVISNKRCCQSSSPRSCPPPPIPKMNAPCIRCPSSPCDTHIAGLPCEACEPPLRHGVPCYPLPRTHESMCRPAASCPVCPSCRPTVYCTQTTTSRATCPRQPQCIENRGRPCDTHRCCPYFVRLQSHDYKMQV